MTEEKKKKNLFKWEISINSMDSLHNLYQMLLFYLRDHQNFAENISLMITLDEDSDTNLHEELKHFVNTRKTTSYLTIVTESEKPAIFRFPEMGSGMEQGYIDRRNRGDR
ncbi:MAG: hypothetical protein HQM11_18685 [SAR324 cluster bacterium]|nr:hypothetical protein [SAR324 cluster bacterium]